MLTDLEQLQFMSVIPTHDGECVTSLSLYLRYQ